MVLVRRDGGSNRPLDDDLNRYSPGFLKKITLQVNWEFPVDGLDRKIQNLIMNRLSDR